MTMKIKLGDFRKLVKEALDESSLAPHHDIELVIEKMVDNWIEDWKSRYDPLDPSMANLGEKEWHSQVFQAGRELSERLIEMVEDVENKLNDGEFYRGGARVVSPKIPF